MSHTDTAELPRPSAWSLRAHEEGKEGGGAAVAVDAGRDGDGFGGSGGQAEHEVVAGGRVGAVDGDVDEDDGESRQKGQ